MVDIRTIWPDRVPVIFLGLALLFGLLEVIVLWLWFTLDVRFYEAWEYNAVFADIPFITTVLAWLATLGGMALILRHGRQKVSAWFILTSYALAFVASVTFAYLVVTYCMGYSASAL